MKKIVATVLAMMMVTSLIACGEAKKDDNNDKSGGKTENSGSQIDFEEVLVVDNEECTIKITGIEEEAFWGNTLKVYVENKSEDKTYMVAVQNASVNGVETDPLFSAEIAAGKKANEEMHFMDSTLEENGVGKFTDIEITFRVYDSNDWLAEEVAIETVHIYPYGEEKAETFVREEQESDIVLVDNESVKVVVVGCEKNETWGYQVEMFLVNKTDANVMFSTDEVSVNGFMVNPLFATDVSAGKCTFSNMTIFESDLEENSIKDVTDIEFMIRAYDADNWDAEDFVNQKVTLNP